MMLLAGRALATLLMGEPFFDIPIYCVSQHMGILTEFACWLIGFFRAVFVDRTDAYVFHDRGTYLRARHIQLFRYLLYRDPALERRPRGGERELSVAAFSRHGSDAFPIKALDSSCPLYCPSPPS